jgi:uncharacterized membrane protein YqhA
MLRRLLEASRYLMLIAVLGAFIAAIAIMVYGGVTTAKAMVDGFAAGAFTPKAAKTLALAFIEMIDLFLLGAVFYIVALGLYELFIDDAVKMPDWLQIHHLDDLKAKLVSVVIVILGVLFLGQVVAWDGERNLLPIGLGSAAMITALTLLLNQKTRHG